MKEWYYEYGTSVQLLLSLIPQTTSVCCILRAPATAFLADMMSLVEIDQVVVFSTALQTDRHFVNNTGLGSEDEETDNYFDNIATSRISYAHNTFSKLTIVYMR